MKTKAITAIMIMLFLASMLSMAFKVAPVKAQVTWTLVANDEITEWDSMGELYVPITIEKGFDGTYAYIRVSPYYASTIIGIGNLPPTYFDLDQVNFRVDVDNSGTWTAGDIVVDQGEGYPSPGWIVGGIVVDGDPFDTTSLPSEVTITWDVALTTATLSFPASWTNLGVAGIEVVGIDEGASVNWYPSVPYAYHPNTWDPSTYADVTFCSTEEFVVATLEDLKTEISGLSDVDGVDLKKPATDRKTDLIDKVDDVIDMVNAGEYMGAIMKLKMDIGMKLDHTAKQSWATHDLGLLWKIDNAIAAIELL